MHKKTTEHELEFHGIEFNEHRDIFVCRYSYYKFTLHMRAEGHGTSHLCGILKVAIFDAVSYGCHIWHSVLLAAWSLAGLIKWKAI